MRSPGAPDVVRPAPPLVGRGSTFWCPAHALCDFGGRCSGCCCCGRSRSVLRAQAHTLVCRPVRLWLVKCISGGCTDPKEMHAKLSDSCQQWFVGALCATVRLLTARGRASCLNCCTTYQGSGQGDLWAVIQSSSNSYSRVQSQQQRFSQPCGLLWGVGF